MTDACRTCNKDGKKIKGMPFIMKDVDAKETEGAIRGQIVKKKKQAFLNIWIGIRIVRDEINYCPKCGRKL